VFLTLFELAFFMTQRHRDEVALDEHCWGRVGSSGDLGRRHRHGAGGDHDRPGGSGLLRRFRGPRLRLTFEAIEPWCRQGKAEGDGTALWVRVGVENQGAGPARGCLGRLISVTTNGALRPDVDPVQLRWAGVPRSRAFDPMDLRRDQREYLNVLCLADGSRWRLVTFEDPDFDPGFATDLPLDQRHVLRFSVFSDNADTVTRSLVAEVGSGDGEVKLHLK
jgi:hypothetical protein